MKQYEVLFIVTPRLSEDDVTATIQEFREIAEQNGATVVSEDAWGKRRLAYPIEKMNEAIYHLFTLESDSADPLNELDRRMKNSDRVIRHMITRIDDDLKRAQKLAAKNPPKEKKAPAPAEPAPEAAAPAAETAAGNE